jgi:RNA polymerase sigma factor (sigma-70 family)
MSQHTAQHTSQHTGRTKTARDEHVETALAGLIVGCRDRDRARFDHHVDDLIATPGDGTYPSYRVAVFARAVAALGNIQDAEEVQNETFTKFSAAAVRTYDNHGRVVPGGFDIARMATDASPARAVGAFLKTIGGNLVNTKQRRYGRYQDALERFTDAAGAKVGEPLDVDTHLDLQAALAQLTPERRAAVVLVDLYGLTKEEVAEHLGISRGHVYNHLRQGHQDLRALLAIST